ncbi:MAG: response regulator [Deltaproteobacteria bacterium]|nr:response regulator [Deltaproteobacteria bacterium]
MTTLTALPPTIMLVDDEAPFVETMTKRLKARDYKVFSANSGAEALKVLEEEGPRKMDVVILDVKMPGMDGLEALALIKQKFPTVEVIMLTGHATVPNAVEGLKGGAFDYLMKPCDMDELVSKLNLAMQKKREHDAKIMEAQARAMALDKGID